MVQRKPPRKLGSQTELSERRLSSHQQQDTRSKGGGELRRKEKKKPSPPVKTSDGSPNYMKPTSSSHARKERLQVTVHSPITTDKNRTPRNLKPSSPSLAGSGIKPVRSLTRNSSLKPVRSSMKKSSGMGLYPKKNVNRGTCSSTLKDSKFPKALDLNPGGTEAEGTSIMKVCPYNYCSLNGHTHETLPPLKCFLSARRRLVKSQKSMKLKRLSSLMAISRTPSGLEINPLFEDVGNDFFVEIYDKPRAQITQSENFDERSFQDKHDFEKPEVLNELSLMEDGWDCKVNQIYGSSLDINYKDVLDQSSDLTNEEMNVLMNFLQYVECDQKVEAKEESHRCFVPKDYADSEANVSASFEVVDMRWEEEIGSYPASKTDFSEYLDDGSDPISSPLLELENAGVGWSFEPDNYSFTCEIAGDDTELSHEDGVIDKGEESPASTILSAGFYEDFGKEEAEDDSLISEVKFSDSPQGYTETAHDIISDADDTSLAASFNNAEEDETLNTPTLTSAQPITDAGGKPKARHKMIRRKTTENVEEIREFNPRAPQFLPVEPDPEAEKVNLRHQLMDERKNVEEWMIDYALREAVSKLAPARKRKVELLIEAFETIMPLPMCETPLQAISGFTHARPIQACN